MIELGETMREVCERVYVARHEIYRHYPDLSSWRVCVSPGLWADLCLEVGPESLRNGAAVFGLRMEADPRLRDREIVLRVEVVA